MASIWDFLGDRADRTFNGNRAVDERKRREEEEERLRLQRLAELEAQQQGYRDDAFADERSRVTRSAIDVGRNRMVADNTNPFPVPTEQPRPYVREQARRASDPILVVEDEVVDTTPSPMSYVMTGETFSDPATTAPKSESNGFWDFLGLSDKEDRRRLQNGLLQASGAILGAGTPDWAEALGKGITAYGKAGTDYDKSVQDRALNDQRIRANEFTMADAETKRSAQARLTRLFQDAGPEGLTSAQRQEAASLYLQMGDAKAAQDLIGAGKVSYQKGETYYAPDGSLYTQVFNPTSGQMTFVDANGSVLSDPNIIRSLRQDDKKRTGSGQTGGKVDLSSLSDGEKKRDEKFGENYETTANDYNRNQVQFAQLENATAILEANPGASGNILTENLPQFLKPYANQDGTIAKERIYEVVQGTLRQILGAQFTEKEGALIMERAFNPNLPVDENIKRVRALAAMLKANTDLNKAKLDYFDENSSLKGFKGNYLTSDDISENVFGTGALRNSNGVVGGPVMNPNSSTLPPYLRKR